MQREGPLLESLTHRLAETPEDFLDEPRIGQTGRVQTAAVVADLVQLLGGSAGAAQLQRFSGADARRDRNRLSITLLLCWLLADEWFRQTRPAADEVLQVLDAEAAELGSRVASRKFVTDPDRREELARLALARLGFRPAGETVSQAQDRLTTLNSAERARVVQAARVAEERARKIREALAKKAAEESADKWTRE
jgi:hypothetical protein